MKLSFMFPCRLVSQDDRGGVAPRPHLPGQLPVGGAHSSKYCTVLTVDCYLTLKYVHTSTHNVNKLPVALSVSKSEYLKYQDTFCCKYLEFWKADM